MLSLYLVSESLGFHCPSLITLQAIGITVYYYSGQYVASPALGSAGVLLKRVAYGVSIPFSIKQRRVLIVACLDRSLFRH